MKGVERGTREYFETIKQQISIEQVADYLMQRQGKNYIYPGEKSASVRLYQNTQSFLGVYMRIFSRISTDTIRSAKISCYMMVNAGLMIQRD